MTALFGIPLFGTFFVPLFVGVVTVFLLWILVVSNNGSQPVDKSPDQIASKEGLIPQTDQIKPKTKDKKQKGCGSDGTCSSKNGKSGGCCSEKAIESVKVFIDACSTIGKDYATVLMDQLTQAHVTCEEVSSSNSGSMDLPKHADGSLCIFIMDTSSLDGHKHWLHRAVHQIEGLDRPLTRMKYAIFMFHPVLRDDCQADQIDQLLHKLGAVRVCKADSAPLSSVLSSSCFDDWAEELFSQVQKWNAPKRKACKCGPKEKQQSDESCGSGKCSDSEVAEEISKTAAKTVLDLEDIAQFL